MAPDAARTFSPAQDWPTVAPLTDEEIGIVGGLPWDGVPGPRLVRIGDDDIVDYPSLDHTDYVANSLGGAFTLALTGAIQEHEYQARVLAMARVYDALGVDTERPFFEVVRAKAQWSVLSFRGMDPADPAAVTASGQAGVGLTTPLYRVEVFLHGAPRPHPTDLARKHVTIRRRWSCWWTRSPSWPANRVDRGATRHDRSRGVGPGRRGRRPRRRRRRDHRRGRRAVRRPARGRERVPAAAGRDPAPGVEVVLRELGAADAAAARAWVRHAGHWVEWGGPPRFDAFGGDAAGRWYGYQAPGAELDSLLLARARRRAP